MSAAHRIPRDEEEFNLYYRVLATHGSPDAIVDRMASGAYRLFTTGSTYPLSQALSVFESLERWDAIYDLCRRVLSVDDKGDSPLLLRFDYRVWDFLVAAAKKRLDHEA